MDADSRSGWLDTRIEDAERRFEPQRHREKKVKSEARG